MDTRRCKASRLLYLARLLLSATLYNLVSGGPDHLLLHPCGDLLRGLRPDQRRTARETVQALQTVDSYLGQRRLGRSLPLSTVNQSAPTLQLLEQWKSQNASKLLSLMESAGFGQQLGSRERAAAMAQECLADRLQPDAFAGRPTVSILLNYFKRPLAIARISASMRASCAGANVSCELVVNVDNPEEVGAWVDEASRGFFVVPVFSANVHEARGYNRAAKLARGRYLVVWQDDQLPPAHGFWLVNMINVFDANPLLGILGMNSYRLCAHHEPTNRYGFSYWLPDPKTGATWTYAQRVDFAPLAIRASAFRAIGGLDEGMARPGDCGIWGDWELCTRAMMDGWLVGFMYLGGRSDDGGGSGTTHVGANGEKCWGRQQSVASNTYHRRYGVAALQNMMCDRVWLLNMLTFKASLDCPYGTELTMYGNCTAPPQDELAQFKAELTEQAAIKSGRGSDDGTVIGSHRDGS